MTEYNPELSLVIPCHNEEGNLRPLIAAINTAMFPLGVSHEVIITDDCSTDNSWRILREMAQTDPRIRVQRLKLKCGESAASWAGIQASRGRYVVTLDADLQNDPNDLPVFLKALKRYDCVCGTRVATRSVGDSLVCTVSSRIANKIRNKILGDEISDSGCTYRAFKRACVANIKFFRGAHRFLPALFKMEGFSVTEVPVRNNLRLSGKSHYGIRNRFLNSIADLLGVLWVRKRLIRYEVIEVIN